MWIAPWGRFSLSPQRYMFSKLHNLMCLEVIETVMDTMCFQCVCFADVHEEWEGDSLRLLLLLLPPRTPPPPWHCDIDKQSLYDDSLWELLRGGGQATRSLHPHITDSLNARRPELQVQLHNSVLGIYVHDVCVCVRLSKLLLTGVFVVRRPPGTAPPHIDLFS